MLKKHNSFLRYFPAPKFLRMPAVGFEVSAQGARFLELLEDSKGYRVGRFGGVQLSVPVPPEENFLENEELKKAVAQIKNEQKLNFITVALPEDKTYIFRTELPEIGSGSVRESIELMLEEHVPIPPKEAIFDYKIVETGEPGKQIVSVSVVPHLVASRYLDFFTSLDLVPTSFQIGAQAVANAVVPCEYDAPSIVVNFGQRTTGLYIVADHTVHFTSTIEVGGASLTEAIKKYFSITTEEAEKLKQEKGVTIDKNDTEFFYALVNTLSALKDEVGKLVSYWGSHLGGESATKQKIERVFLCGVEASLEGLPEYLEASLGFPVVLANVWGNAFSFDRYLPPLQRKESLGYASVIGLSLHDSC